MIDMFFFRASSYRDFLKRYKIAFMYYCNDTWKPSVWEEYREVFIVVLVFLFYRSLLRTTLRRSKRW
jgi:hypothetical protein